MAIRTKTLLAAVTASGAGIAKAPRGASRTFQAKGSTSAGAGAASIDIEASNDGTNWVLVGTIALTLGVAETSDGFASDAPWVFVRANLTAISGTNAAVTVLMGD